VGTCTDRGRMLDGQLERQRRTKRRWPEEQQGFYWEMRQGLHIYKKFQFMVRGSGGVFGKTCKHHWI
jgi:hypothetical protein